MAVVKVLGGLRRFARTPLRLTGDSVEAVLHQLPVPDDLLFPGGQLNPDIEVLVNGRNVRFLSGTGTVLDNEDRLTIFFNGARGYPGG